MWTSCRPRLAVTLASHTRVVTAAVEPSMTQTTCATVSEDTAGRFATSVSVLLLYHCVCLSVRAVYRVAQIHRHQFTFLLVTNEQ